MKPNFEVISEADIIKKARDAQGDKKYIKRPDLDRLAELTGCDRDTMIDWLCAHGLILDRQACGHSAFRDRNADSGRPGRRRSNQPEEKDRCTAPNYREPILRLAKDMLENMSEEEHRLTAEVEAAKTRYEEAKEALAIYTADVLAVDELVKRLENAAAVTITDTAAE